MAFFKWRKSEPAPARESDETRRDDADAAGDAQTAGGLEPEGDDEGGEPEVDPDEVDQDAERAWRARAEAVIAGGSSTGSKRAEALYGAEPEFGPTHFTRASGCRLTTAAGATLVDCTMSLGAVAIGYGDRLVTQSVIEAAAAGNVSGLAPTMEVEVAERLCEVIPCAERVRFLKTGAEAVAAAVRIARTATGRTHVVGSGYFGWLGWWGDSPTAGVPAGVRADYTHVPFDDVPALERAAAAAGDRLAAIVLEPVVERLPSEQWIAAARSICDRRGAVLIFDEIKTGFRLATGGFQQYANVKPDLATFGKAMANGFPLSAVVGRADVMEAAGRTWISSTLASETTGLAAALAVLEWHERAEVAESLWSTGRELRGVVEAAAASSGVEGVSIDGIDPMWLMRFTDERRQRRFQELALRYGVLFKRGAYNFAAIAHDEDAIREVERAASTAFVELVEEEEREAP